MKRGGIIVFCILAVVWWYSTTTNTNTKTLQLAAVATGVPLPTATALPPASSELQLASLDAGMRLEPGDALIAFYSVRLDSLDRKCWDGRSRLADYIVVAQRDLKAVGKAFTLAQVLAYVDAATPPDAPRMDCSQIVAAWVTLTKR